MKGNNIKKYYKPMIYTVFVIYIFLLMNVLFFSDYYGRTQILDQYTYNVIPFKEIKRFIIYRNNMGFIYWLTNLLGNIIAFIPMGFFMPIISKHYKSFLKVTFSSLFISLMIETLQLYYRVGIFDVDDIILNTLGGAIGYILYKITKIIYKKIKRYTVGEKDGKISA
ncbi:glycopeptide antibiotics resistance protein [Natranaerovirga hydrolytica]|uniref:Glycopeptide antibiotics resistance protein n=1 Tax=Natranaerovirga hydrolytica TaxID=680378 RepID=A0A4V2PZN4_9FIRM|nr:VanZ family protein [Natranaerovirga hydrolytica]TCK90531.1 glycopeptide antibiotics resistance protein [Natranaerovirga hydrolytica]